MLTVLRSQDKEFITEIQALVQKWRKCNAEQMVYIEKKGGRFILFFLYAILISIYYYHYEKTIDWDVSDTWRMDDTNGTYRNNKQS